MKNVLFATFSMIMMAGIAHADAHGGGITVGGSANFGVKYDDAAATNAEKLKFHHEFDISFSASGTTDGGLGFGAKVTIDNNESLSGASTGTFTTTLSRNVMATAATAGTVQAACYLVNGKLFSSDELSTFTDLSPSGADGAAFDLGGGLVTFADNEAAAKAILAGSKGVKINLVTDKRVSGSPSQGEIDVGDYLATGAGKGIAIHRVEATADTAIGFTNCGAAADSSFVGLPLIPTTTVSGASPGKVANNATVYISLDNNKLTIGEGMDSGDVAAGGIADVGFDGVGVDDLAEAIRGKTKKQIRYDGSFGVGSVAVTYGDEEWAAGFNFDVAPVKVGAGFDSNGVMSVGLGLSQGQVSGNIFYSADNDTNGDAAGQPKAKGMGVDMSYAMSDATKVTIAFGRHENEASQAKKDAFGLGFSHSLGGGATLAAGAASVDKKVKADLGVSMKF